MRIVRSVRHKVCADGSFMKEFVLDTPLPEGFFTYLESFGTVESRPAIGEGFYKFDKKDWFSIKGFVGDSTVEVRFRKEVMDLTMDFLYLLFSRFREEKPELAMLKKREISTGEKVQKFLYGE